MDIEKKQENNDAAIQIIDSYGHIYVTKEEISKGGQGAVYLTDDPFIAVKLVFDEDTHNIMTVKKTPQNTINAKNEAFFKLIHLPLPKNENITLPFSTLKSAVGYTMRLMEDMASFDKTFTINNEEIITGCMNEKIAEVFGDSPLTAVMCNYAGSGGIRRRLNAYYLCACILSRIHAQGLVYCDFSDNNAFISKNNDYYENDNVWLIDADNINFQDVTLKLSYYTPMYGAPEVVRGEGCSFYSDCYSFSVSFFKSMIMNHPFKGVAYEEFDGSAEEADDALQLGQLAYVFDENDDSNNLGNFIVYLSEQFFDDNIKPLFNRTFINGKNDLRKRPSMMEWAENISKALDSQLVCSVCKIPYINIDDVRLCPWCDNINKVLIISSYTENDQKIRDFRREYVDVDSFDVPLRLIKGVNAFKPKEKLLNVCISHDAITVRTLNDEYLIYIAKTGERIFGAYEISIGNILLSVEDISDNIRYKLEVKII